MTIHKYLNRIISSIKREEFVLDENIPLGYLFNFFLNKLLQRLIGVYKFRRLRRVFVHPSATIKCTSKIHFEENLCIDRNCYIDALSEWGIIAGRNLSIGRYTTITCSGSMKFLGKGISIGNNVGLGTRGHYGCAGGIKIGDDTIIGDYVSMHSENHNFKNTHIPIRLQGVNHQGIVIGKNCWIGAKVTILDGTRLGDGCVVAAGSVVRGTIPANTIIGGIPAKVIRNRI